jgi:hypothetical protein
MGQRRTRMSENQPTLPASSRIPPTDAESAANQSCVDAIVEDGDCEKWPPWDGLSDERGPIPVFDAARTNASGQVLMSDEERAARRDAAMRALVAVGDITDETDNDEVWAEVFRGLEGAL